MKEAVNQDDFEIRVGVFDSPLGPIVGATTSTGLVLLEFGGLDKIEKDLNALAKTAGLNWGVKDHPILSQTQQELAAYFNGELQVFKTPLDLGASGNDFSRSVWQSLRQIPYGTTWTYKQQANYMNNPLAIRAIAAANGRNPIAVIVPCHRVIGSNGSLTGYAGGIEKKRSLLQLEINNSPKQRGNLF